MRLSKRSEYGIKATVRLAQKKATGYVQSRELAESEDLPAKFLESILLALRSASILESKVGAGGGYRLARPAEQIKVTDLITALEPAEEELEETPAREPSPGRAALELINERLSGVILGGLGTMSVAELVQLSEERMAAPQRSMYYI
ncbi:MAG: Rrf2 family transcriptional regulator [Planctomycetota bacterium]|nr:Rrf2 family transcriptional regulator [Planctomycetota bacterium]